MDTKELKTLKKNRVKSELKVEILNLLIKFKPKSEPDVKLTKTDIVNVLSSIVVRKTE